MARYVVQCGWDDVPHLDEKTKKELYNALPPHERAARMRGEPAMGAGRVFPIDEKEIVVEPFPIPRHWPVTFGADFSTMSGTTAVVWAAIDEESDCVYLFSEHYKKGVESAVHASAIKSRGKWIEGVGDWAGVAGVDDTRKIIDLYRRDHDILIQNAYKGPGSVESGLQKMFNRMSTGRLKVFSTLTNWLGEFRTYRRDDKLKIVKEHDHAMDATRYMIDTGLRLAMSPLDYQDQEDDLFNSNDYHSGQGRNKYTGY